MAWNQSQNIKMSKSSIDLDHILSRDKPRFDIGSDGQIWAIFRDNCYSFEYLDLIGGLAIGHWNQYENAVLIQQGIGL